MEVEDGMDLADDAGKDADNMEKDDELSPEEKEELAKNIKDLRDTIKSLKDTLGDLKTVKEPFLKKAFKFVGTTAAAAVIFSLIGFGLKKLIDLDSGGDGGGGGGDNDNNKKKLAKTTALTKVLDKLGSVVNTLTKWMTAHKDDTIVLSGVTIPMVDFFTKEVDAMSDVSACQLRASLDLRKYFSIWTSMRAAVNKAMDEVYRVSKTLVVKSADGKTNTYNAPSTGQMSTIVSNAKIAYNQLAHIVFKANEHKGEYPAMATMPVKQADLDEINDDIGTLSSLPYED